MATPLFLLLDEVLAIHAQQIEVYGGDHGIRDLGLVESAIARPEQSFGDEYVHGTLCEQAAAYLFHLCKNHGFVDGNKRVALACALGFLGMNGVFVDGSHHVAAAQLTEGVAKGVVSKAAVAVWFEQHRSE